MTGIPSAATDQLAHVMAFTGDLIDGIRPDKWAAATPCAAWTVRPGVADRIYQAPIGPAPGAALLHIRITEALVHGWDIAQATSRHAEFPAEVAEQELAISRRMLGGVPRNGRFGPALDLPADAPAIDRLAAFLGHRPLPVGPE